MSFNITGTIKSVQKLESQSGYSKARVLLINKDSKRRKYQKYYIIFWRDTADEVLRTCCRDESLRICGDINVNENTNKIELIGQHFQKVKWSEDDKRYVALSLVKSI